MRKALILICTLILLASCGNALLSSPVPVPEDGMGIVQISFGNKIRTLLPTSYNILKMKFVLTFIPDAGGEQVVKTLDRETSITVQLPEGDWTLQVKGFTSGANIATDEPSAVGNKNFTVTATNVITVEVNLFPEIANLNQKTSGTLNYNITIPAGATGFLAVYDCPDPMYPLPNTDTPVRSVNFTSTNYNQGSMELKSGFYHVSVSAVYNGKEQTWRELAHIYDDTVTMAENVFTTGDFYNASQAAITHFSFTLPNGDPVPDGYVYIDDITGTITLFVLPDTDISALTPVYSYTGAMIDPVPQGPLNLNFPKTYKVYTEAGMSKTYTVSGSYTINNLELLSEFLSKIPENTPDNPIPIGVQIDLSGHWWADLLNVINIAGRYIDLSVAYGTGMTVFNPNAGLAPGAEYTGKMWIVSLTLPNTSTSIPDGTSADPAFRYFSVLKKIKGAGINSIGNYAFGGCETLESVEFPVLVTLRNNVFRNCIGLTSVTLPTSTASISMSAFRDCTNLADINITAGNPVFRSVEGFLCRNNPVTLMLCPEGKKGTVTIPAGITVIGSTAFSYCTEISNVIIPNTITSTESSIFSGLAGLTVTINTNITSWTQALANTTDLTVILGNNITSIGNSAFSGCSEIISFTIPNGVSSIGKLAFQNCTGLTGITIPASVYTIGNSVFSGLNNLKVTINTNSINNTWTQILNGASDLAIVFGSTVRTIANSAFSGCIGLTSVTFPTSITSIGTSAFAGCINLPALTLPSSVTSIGSSAFSGCTKLTNAILPANLSRLESDVFLNCIVLNRSGDESFTLPTHITYIGSNAFSGCAALTGLVLPDSVTFIGSNVFNNCINLRTSSIPVNVTSIGNSIYSGCNTLTVTIGTNSIRNWTPVFANSSKVSVIFGSGITNVWSSSFSGCSALVGVTLSGSITSIDNFAFMDCTALASVTLQAGLTRVGSNGFLNCSALTSINLPATLTTIGAYAFDGCTRLANVQFNSILTQENFSQYEPFRGDLRIKYFLDGGGKGLYRISMTVDGYPFWVKN